MMPPANAAGYFFIRALPANVYMRVPEQWTHAWLWRGHVAALVARITEPACIVEEILRGRRLQVLLLDRLHFNLR